MISIPMPSVPGADLILSEKIESFSSTFVMGGGVDWVGSLI